uniref:Secreted protein n=1 Tax=Glossina austeni TaxID=7395 RepID=A0A1A9UK02_GLOAU
MHFYRWCLLQAVFCIGLVAVAYASRREVGQHLAEVNQPKAETLLQPIKFGLKTATKQAKPEDISTFNYIRNGTFAKNSFILPRNQTAKTFSSARPGIDQKFPQQHDIPTKGTSIGHQQHSQLQSKQNQHQLEKRKQRSPTKSSMVRHNSRSIVRKSSARGKPAQPTASSERSSHEGPNHEIIKLET